MAAPHFSADDAKRALRQQLKARRAGCDPALGAALATHLLADRPPPLGVVVAGYWPISSEIDIRPLLAALAARGHPIGLPETTPPGQPLIFRRWQPGEALLAGRFRTFHPAGEPLRPDWLLVPLLGFDRAGHRLGYGGGYYDRTLATLPGAVAIGCAFACQEVDAVPATEYDARLAAVATERGLIPCDGE